MKKPFVEGSIATGKYFIGRKEDLKKFSNLIKNKYSGCISVCGLPRIGKTSIVRKALNTKSKKILPVFVNLSTITSFYDLWKNIIMDIFAYFDKLEIAFAFEDAKKKILDACHDKDYSSLREHLMDFIKEISKEKYKYIIVMDEFDYICRGAIGEGDECGTNLNCLRDIFSQRPDLKMTLIVISRRDIASLETNLSYGSTFYGVFGNNIINVLGFNDDDYKRYLKILEKNKVVLDKKACNDIEIYGGRSPYLLAQIGNYLCENAGVPGDIREFSRNQSMINYYKNLISILKDENYYEAMIKIFVGPKYDLTPYEVDELRNLGYIHFYKDKDAEKPRALTKDFTRYLHELIMQNESQDIWPKLSQTELRLREIIEKVLITKFGQNWEKDIRAIYNSQFASNYLNFINLAKADNFIANTQKQYPGKPCSLLKVLSIWELKNLIDFFWHDGISACFTGITKKELLEKLDHLQFARDPLAHSNPEYLNKEELRLAEVYCDQILSKSHAV